MSNVKAVGFVSRHKFAKITTMKSLNLARPQMLLVVGNPGAGKSFFARQFSETFDAPAISVDRIRYELFAKQTFSADENDLVNRMASYFTDELLKTKRSFLLDGGCNARTDRARLTQEAKKAGYDVSVIWIQTDLATCRARALKRNPKRSEDDKFTTAMDDQTFEALVRRFTEPNRENYVVISGKHTYNTQAKMVLRKMVAAREAVAEAAHRQETEQVRQSSRPETGPGTRRSVVIR